MKKFIVGLFYVVAIMVCGWPVRETLADGMIVIRDPPAHRGYYAFAPLEVKYHHVTTKITDQVAVTEVDQTFFNPNNQRLEGTYIFPIPKGAQIDKFSMDINGKQMEAELLDADKARGVYEDIVRKMRDPALLEYAGQAMLKLRIFPIEPNSEKRIQLKYTQLLHSENGLVEYLYPLNTEKFSSAPLKSVSVNVELTCKQPIKSVYSPSHEVEIKRHDNTTAAIGYEANNVTPNTDFQLFFSSERKNDIGLNVLTYNDGADSDGGSFLMMLSPSAEMRDEKIVEKDVVFVLDKSGSMADDHKIEQAQKALLFCLKNLNKGDRFEIVRFSTEAEPLFGQLGENTEAHRKLAEEFVTGLKTIGGTAIEDALLKALEPARNRKEKDRPYMIVFLTDGKPTVGTTDEDQIVSSVSKAMTDIPVRIFCFGIGTDINTHLLDKITEKTHAASQYVLPSEDIEVKVSNFYTKINDPVLANLKLTFSGVRITKMEPAEMPDLFRGEQLVVFGRYSGSGDSAIRLEGTVNGKSRTLVYEATFHDKATEYSFIPRLWATRRVGFLLDQIRLHGESKELKDEVTDLARRYGIVTPYTAFLIVEDETHRNVPVLSRTLQTLGGDEPVRREAERMYREVNNAKDGHAAVGGAQSYDSLKSAKSASAPAAANAYAQRGQVGERSATAETVQTAIHNQQTRSIASRTFYQNGSLWIDSNVQQRQDAKRVQVKFNSEEYFALMAKYANAAQWLSVGRNVQILLGETVYEVVE